MFNAFNLREWLHEWDIKIFYKNIACLKASFIDTCSLLVLASKPLYAIRLITARLSLLSVTIRYFSFFLILFPEMVSKRFLDDRTEDANKKIAFGEKRTRLQINSVDMEKACPLEVYKTGSSLSGHERNKCFNMELCYTARCQCMMLSGKIIFNQISSLMQYP